MKVKLLGESARPDAVASSENPAAHNAVLQSDFYFQQQTAESVRKSISFLQEAVRLDPNYALAYAKLSQAWRQSAASFAIDDASKAYDEARQAADKAVSLAPDLVEVRMTVGLLAMNPGLDFPAAEKNFAMSCNRLRTTPPPKTALCLSLLAQGRLTEAEEACRQALLLDPLLTNLWFNLGRITVGTGRYKEAGKRFAKDLSFSRTLRVFIPTSPRSIFCKTVQRRRWRMRNWRTKVSGATMPSLWCNKRRRPIGSRRYA